MFGSLDNGFRSKCHFAPIRIGFKKIKGTNQKLKIWVCTRCKARDVDIIPYSYIKSQVQDLDDRRPLDLDL